MARKPRPPRKPAPGTPDGPHDALRIDSDDAVLRVLSDFDFDPSRTSQDDVERRIHEATGRRTGPVATTGSRPGAAHEAYISEILAELMDRDEEAEPLPATQGRETGSRRQS